MTWNYKTFRRKRGKFGGFSGYDTKNTDSKKKKKDTWLMGLVDWVPACEPKDRWFESQSRAPAQVVGQGSNGGSVRSNHTSMCLSLSFSLPSPLSKNK